VDVLAQVTAVPDVASLGVESVRAGRCPVLDGAPGLEGRQIAKARNDCLLALTDRQRAEGALLEEELGEVRPGQIARGLLRKMVAGVTYPACFGPWKSEEADRSSAAWAMSGLLA
jgi:hypothetical protein